MKKRILLCLAVVLMSCLTAAAQDAKMQPLTFWYEYTVNPGKEAQFLELVKTVGAPVREKMLADGVVLAWGVEVPLLRMPGSATHVIWYSVADWSGIEKVDNAMHAQIAKLDEEAMKSGTGKKGSAGGATVTARMTELCGAPKAAAASRKPFGTSNSMFSVVRTTTGITITVREAAPAQAEKWPIFTTIIS